MINAGTREAVNKTAAKRHPDSNALPTGRASKFLRSHALLISLAIVSLLSALIYARTLNIGFLIDDVWHQDYLHQGFNGNPNALLKHIYGGWSLTTDGLACYRPGTTLSLALDYLFWGANAIGYHASNLLIYAICTLFVGLTAAKLGQLFKYPRSALCAVSAALLFAVYPLHAESVSWIIGRVDLLCTMFYVAALFAYLSWIQNPRPQILATAALLFVGSLSSKEMAVTLPVVITALCVLLPRTNGGASTSGRLKSALLFWGVLSAFAVLRTSVLGTVIGGYGSLSKDTLLQAWANFTDSSTWQKIAYGVSDEVTAPRALTIAAFSLLAIPAAGLVAALRKSPRLLIFCAFWLCVSLLPAFQIFHVFPNLSGSRLFFLSSAPFCMLIAFGFVGLNTTKARLSVGSAIICILASFWLIAQQANLTPWVEAGSLMKSAFPEVQTLAQRGTVDSPILFINLPTDHKGAGLIGRPEYLRIMLKPPFAPSDISKFAVTAERPIPGRHDGTYPIQFAAALSTIKEGAIWNDVTDKFDTWRPATGAANINISNLPLLPAGKGAFLTNTKIDLNPQKVRVIKIELAKEPAVAPSLVWRAPNQIWWQCEIPPSLVQGKTVFFVPSRLRSWTYADHITGLGIRGDHKIEKIESVECFEPTLRIVGAKRSSQNIFLQTVDAQSESVNVQYDTSNLPTAKKVCILVGKPFQALPDQALQLPPDTKAIAWQKTFDGVSGTVQLPANLLKQNTLQQVSAVALDANERPVGVLSEPLTLQLETTR